MTPFERRLAKVGEVFDPPPGASPPDLSRYAGDPLGLAADYWPSVRFYDKQVEIVESVRDCDETVVVSAHKMGKDFVAGFVCLSFFLAPWAYFPAEYYREVESRRPPGQPHWMAHTRRVVTTSVKDEHIDILWGEVGRYVATAASPLLFAAGGPLVVNYHEIRLADEMASKNPVNYLKGQVSQKGEGMQGHHAAYTLLAVDEASGVEDVVFERADSWAKRKLIFGNPYGLNHWFHRAVKGGDLAVPPGG